MAEKIIKQCYYCSACDCIQDLESEPEKSGQCPNCLENKLVVVKIVEIKPEPCIGCNQDGLDVTYSPDPYASEINHDQTPVWECARCRQESADDI